MKLSELDQQLDELKTLTDSEKMQLDEILDLGTPISPPAEPPSLPKLPHSPLEKKRSTFSMIWITSALLFGLFVGIAFGFFWGKSKALRETPMIEPQEKMSYWLEELKNLIEKTPEEIIEPLEPSKEMRKLAPTEMT